MGVVNNHIHLFASISFTVNHKCFFGSISFWEVIIKPIPPFIFRCIAFTYRVS